MAYTWPVPLNSPITQYFAANPYSPVQPAGHTGMDFAVPVGTSVKAIGPGTVRWADWATKLSPSNPWYIAPAYAGIVVLIDHGNIMSVYAHLNSTHLNVGQSVAQGAEIGKSGNTGLSSGPHLHFEIFPDPITGAVNWLANRLNPLDYITKATYNPAPAPVQLKANQRRVGAANVNLRSEPSTEGKILRIIQANTIEEFTGYVVGERINGKNLWYKDAQGYAHCDGFTTQVTTGLPNLTPKPIPVTYRTTGPAVGNVRVRPELDAPEIHQTKPNMTYDVEFWTQGDSWEGSNVWFRIQNSEGWVHSKIFTSQSTEGLKKVTIADPTWRKTGPAGGTYRKTPHLDGEALGTLKPDTNYIMKSWTEGDSWEGSNIWFQSTLGWWAHSKLFTSQATTALTKVVIEAPEPAPVPSEPTPTPVPDTVITEKTVVDVGVRLRGLPTTNATIKSVIPGGSKVSITGYVTAQEIENSDIWFVATAGGYIHSSGVTDASISGLVKKTTPDLSVPTGEPPYSFTPDFDFVEYKPANTWNMQNDNFPATPKKVVLHQFDAKAKKPSIEGVISHFQTDRRPNASSAHFVVSGKRIVQMVSLKDRAFHAGPTAPEKNIRDSSGTLINGNEYIGIEIDPQEDADTVASVKKLLTAIKNRYGYLPEYTKHRDVPNTATECGVDIHLEKYVIDSTPVEPAPKPTPVPVEPDAPSPEQISYVLDYLLRTHSKG